MVLEVGSYDVGGFHSPGTIRDHAPPGIHYIGSDIAAGPNVDVVVAVSEDFPFQDASFDAVIASSVFEHDIAFWATFLEMVRVTKPGGLIYINAPSNGSFHQFPVDNWRFYPDAGLALEKWSKRNKRPVRLVESFITERKLDIWNDFCAVFACGPDEPRRHNGFIADQMACTNIRKFVHDHIEKHRGETEDMILGNATYKGPTGPAHTPVFQQVEMDGELPEDALERLTFLTRQLNAAIGPE